MLGVDWSSIPNSDRGYFLLRYMLTNSASCQYFPLEMKQSDHETDQVYIAQAHMLSLLCA